MAPMICISRVTIALVILNATDQPGLVIPAGFTKSGLPLYLRLVCQPFGEAMLYRVAQFYEDATDWTELGKLSGEYWPWRNDMRADRANVVSEGV